MSDWNSSTQREFDVWENNFPFLLSWLFFYQFWLNGLTNLKSCNKFIVVNQIIFNFVILSYRSYTKWMPFWNSYWWVLVWRASTIEKHRIVNIDIILRQEATDVKIARRIHPIPRADKRCRRPGRVWLARKFTLTCLIDIVGEVIKTHQSRLRWQVLNSDNAPNIIV